MGIREGELISKGIEAGEFKFDDLNPQGQKDVLDYGEEQGFLTKQQRSKANKELKLPTVGATVGAVATAPARVLQSTAKQIVRLPEIAKVGVSEFTQDFLGGFQDVRNRLFPGGLGRYGELQDEAIRKQSLRSQQTEALARQELRDIEKSPVLQPVGQELVERAQKAPVGRFVTGVTESAAELGGAVLSGQPLAFFGGKTATEETGRRLLEGEDVGKALVSGVTKGGLEAGTELLPLKLIGKAFKGPAKQALANYISATVTDVVGENLNNLGANIVDKVVFEEGDPLKDTLAQAPETTLQTIALGLLVGGTGKVANNVKSKLNKGEQLTDADVQSLLVEFNEKGQEVPELKGEDFQVTEPDARRAGEFRKQQRESIATALDPVIKAIEDGADVKDQKFIKGNETLEFAVKNITTDKVLGDQLNVLVEDVLMKPKQQNTQTILNELSIVQNDLVNNFGLKANSKTDKLITKFGDGRLSKEALVKQVGQAQADRIDLQSKMIRELYDRYYNRVNDSLIAQGKQGLPKIENYFRAFNKPTFMDKLRQISEIGATAQEYTALEKELSILKERKGTENNTGALAGLVNYIPQMAYQLNINPQINVLKQVADEINNASGGQLEAFKNNIYNQADLLAGNRTQIDNLVRGLNEKGFDAFVIANRLARANKVTFKPSVAVSQFLNLPNGALVLMRGGRQGAVAGFQSSIQTALDLADLTASESYNAMQNSAMMTERYLDLELNKFDEAKFKALDNAKAMVELSDKLTSSVIWMSLYNKGNALGVDNPTQYADVNTREAIGGRGIGERTVAQQSELFKAFAPFTLEVGNTLRLIGKSAKNVKSDAFGLLIFGLMTMFLGDLQEKIVGRRGGSFDYGNIVRDAFQGDSTIPEAFGRLGAETLNSLPMGSAIAGLLPQDTRKKLFGQDDPSRFGTGATAVKDVQTAVSKATRGDLAGAGFQLATSFTPTGGGSQIRQSTQALTDVARGRLTGREDIEFTPEQLAIKPYAELQQMADIYLENYQPVLREDGRVDARADRDSIIQALTEAPIRGESIRAGVAQTPENVIRAGLFGRTALPEIGGPEGYYQNLAQRLSAQQSAKYNKLVEEGFEPQRLLQTLQDIKSLPSQSNKSRADFLRSQGYSPTETRSIINIYF